MKFGSSILRCFFDDETEKKINPVSSSLRNSEQIFLKKLIKSTEICTMFLIILLIMQLSFMIYIKNHDKTGVTKIRTKVPNISTKIEQNFKPHPRYFGRRKTLYIV